MPFTKSEAAITFKRVLAEHNVFVDPDPSAFCFGNQCIILGINDEGIALSEQLFDSLFPPSTDGIYHHFTTYGNFKKIVSTGKLRLYNLHKRFKSGEFRTFCRDHSLDGYLRLTEDGIEEGAYTALMNDLFYVSLVDSDAEDSEEHWNLFANKHKGIRLSFMVNPHVRYPNFRRVIYQNPDCIPVLQKLKNSFLDRGYHLVHEGLSRMGGFYQRSEFAYQVEHRLLAKNFHDSHWDFPFKIQSEGNANVKFIEVDLKRSDHNWFNIQLKQVVTGRDCDLEKAVEYMRQQSVFPELIPTAASLT